MQPDTFKISPLFWLFLAAVLGGSWWIVRHIGRGREALTQLLSIPPADVAAIVLVALLYFFLQGIILGMSYKIMKISRPPLYGALMFLASNFVNTVAPVVGLSGSAYLVFTEGKRGISRPRAILISIIFYLIDYAAFLLILLLAGLFLAFDSPLPHSVFVGTGVFATLIVLLAMATGVLFTHPTLLRKVLRRFKRIGEDKANSFADQAQVAYYEAFHSPKLIAGTACIAFANHFVAMGVVAIALSAAGITPTLQFVLAGYTVGTLLAVVSITPAGLGVAEGGMVAAFVALGIPIETAILVSLLYRFGIVIVPLILGLPALHAVQRQSGAETIQAV